MACPKPSVVVSALILLVLAMAAAGPAIALKLEPTGTGSHIPPLLDCAPSSPEGAASSGSSNLSAFRANVLSLLAALPVSAAAAPTGFAAAQSESGGGDRAFARALCFGLGGSSPDGCLECLSAAAQDVADGCHGRRGAIWRAGCFLWYADTNASTAREDAWRGWFYDDDDTPTAAPGGQCLADHTAADCSRCLEESARVVPVLKEGQGRSRKLSLVHQDAAVVVVGYSCYLRVPLTPRWERYVVGVIGVVGILFSEVLALLLCIREAREFVNPA